MIFMSSKVVQVTNPITKEVSNRMVSIGSYVRNIPKGNARNKPCTCGSGLKLKFCCWNKQQANLIRGN